MRLKQIHIKNYKAFQDVVIKDIPPLAVFIGANGTGKSTLFDVLAFLRDCLRGNVTEAITARGGYSQLASRNSQNQPISLNFNFVQEHSAKHYIYNITISETKNIIAVDEETLESYIKSKTLNTTIEKYIKSNKGKARIYPDLKPNETSLHNTELKFTKLKPDTLVLNTLDFSAYSECKPIVDINILMKKMFFLGDFPVSKLISSATFEEHCYHDKEGRKLSSVWSNTSDETKETVLSDLQRYIPDLHTVLLRPLTQTENKLEFKAKAFAEAFEVDQLSEGSLKLFQYLLKLHSPEKSPLLCISEPENDLYHAVLPSLMDEFDVYSRTHGQVFVTTHSPQLLNTVELDSVYYLVKQPDGFTKIFKASDNDTLKSLADGGDKPGWLWSHQLFDGIDP